MKVTPVPIADRPGASQDPAKVIALMKHAEAGDIIQERADTYFVAKILTAVIPGFWSHTQIFIGTADHIRALDNDPSVEELVRELVAASPTRLAGVTRFSEVVERLFPEVWAMLCSDEAKQKGGVSIEALMTPDTPTQKSKSEVQFSSVQSTTSEYLGVLRPRVPKRDVALMLLRAFSHLGDKFDAFQQFTANSEWYCSKFATRMYAPDNGMVKGLQVPAASIGNFQVMLPNDISRLYDQTAGESNRPLDFVAFLEKGVEGDPTSENAEYLFRLSSRDGIPRYTWW